MQHPMVGIISEHRVQRNAGWSPGPNEAIEIHVRIALAERSIGCLCYDTYIQARRANYSG